MYTRGVTVQLQSRTMDVKQAYDNINNITDLMMSINCDITEKHSQWYSMAVTLAESLDVLSRNLERPLGNETETMLQACQQRNISVAP